MESFIPNILKEKVNTWRKKNYPSSFSTIEEILSYNFIESNDEINSLRYLRKPQIEALETYWYLRLIENTPKVFELYNKLFKDTEERFKALGIELSSEIWKQIALSGKGADWLLDKIKSDNQFVKKNKLEAVRETLDLQYPSYILALAMGAGKTVLIGSIIASEFAMALEHGNDFVKNALVFAPGKTILGALKELSDVPYSKILPPSLYKQFITSVKFTYTQDGQKDIPIIERSSYNIVVTNTEKIRIQKSTGRAKNIPFFNLKDKEKLEQKEEEANARLKKISSLPNLAIFSDEAHHTYGQNLDTELKKVRRTVDYLANNTSVKVVVNTTGTPYYQKQILKDVVYWYGLSQGIADGYLKNIHDSVFAYDTVTDKDFLNIIIDDFFSEYKDVKLPDSSTSKLAIYFPQTDDLIEARPIVQKKLMELGLDPSIVIEVTSKSDEKTKDFFNNRIKDVHNPYRIYLLVNMGTEGWNVPSLFATALARKLKSSNNFVLQSASRCLRQVPGNTKNARIYLSKDNYKVLDTQLQETFRESLELLLNQKTDLIEDKIILRTLDVPQILIKKKIPKVIRKETSSKELLLTKPTIKDVSIHKTTYSVKSKSVAKEVLSESYSEDISLQSDSADIFQVANDLSSIYRLDDSELYSKLKELYPEGDIPYSHVSPLKEQIERQISFYETIFEDVEVALALVKPEGFNKSFENGKVIYTAEIMYHKSKAEYLLEYDELKEFNSRDLSFHYSPYNMDSKPEKNFISKLLDSLNEDPDNIKGIYFTGALTDANKTDFLFEYKDERGKWHTYTPDFVIIKKNKKVLIVEIKGDPFKDKLKEAALREIENLNKDKIKYEIISTVNDTVNLTDYQKVKKWIYD
ncbi:MAG: DEAD/DEAH box helicase family protein [Ignavibacteriaceae bacterium]